MQIKDFFSPNYDKNKRSKKAINFIVIHYTGMQSERESINRLCDFESKVSSHYFISKKGKVLRLVQEDNVAWHAGKSCWSKYKNLNKNSIGIELSNKGHEFGYSNFNSKQISKLIALCDLLIKKYKIPKKNIVGHSDIAFDRKKDPGEKFPWELLSKKKIGIWHNLNKTLLKKKRNKKPVNESDKIQFINNIRKIGYCVKISSDKNFKKRAIEAFQRRFRKVLINGILDLECVEIASNLVKNIK